MKRLEDMDNLMSKNKEDLDEQSISAKMETLMELLQMAQKEMGHKVKGGMDELLSPKQDMQKVSVMAPDMESLKEGLDKAKELTSDLPEKPEYEGEMSDKKDEPMEMKSEENEIDPDEEDDGGLFSKRHSDKKKKKPFFQQED